MEECSSEIEVNGRGVTRRFHPYVSFDKILAAFNQHNSRGSWFYQTERDKIPMVDVSHEQAANFFYTVEVNLNQTTMMVGYMPATAKVRAVDTEPKGKLRDKSQIASGSPGSVKAESAPSSPLKREGPAPSKQAVPASSPRPNALTREKGNGKNADRPD